MAMKAKRCAIIGAGLGGLSAAIRIASLGIQVDVFEQSSSAGGKAAEISANGFRFDCGPSVLTMPFIIENLFKEAGDDLGKYCTIEPLERHCRYYYSDGTIINAHRDTDRFASKISAQTTDSASSVIRYLEYTKSIYDLTAQIFLFRDFHEWRDILDLPGSWKTLLQLNKIDSLRTVHRANASFFKDPRTIQLFDRYATYNGSDPYQAPATLNIIPHVEYNMGSYMIRQGIHALPSSLASLAQARGVTFYFNTRVTAIVTAGANVTGIRIGTEFRPYDIVISNADVTVTYRDLLQGITCRAAKRYHRLEPSTSALVFYWGVKGLHPELGIHSILFSNNYHSEFTDIFTSHRCPIEPTIYIYISSRYKPDDAPRGYENWFVMVNAPHDMNQDWSAEVARLRERVLAVLQHRLNIDLKSKITFEEVCTPPDIESKTSSLHGSLYGISSNSRSAAFLRHRIRSRDISGLFFCGGSAHPGGGIPLVVLSGMIAGDLIKRYHT